MTVRSTGGISTTGGMILIFNEPPVWVTVAGSLGSQHETETTTSKSYIVEAQDPDSFPTALVYSIISGALPTGAALDSSSGVITGPVIPVSEEATFNFTIKAFDGISFANRAFAITVNNNVAPAFTTGIDLGTIHESTSLTTQAVQIVATDADNLPDPIEYTFGPTGTPPTGAILDLNTGIISGPVVSVAVNTQFTFDITADDGEDITIKSFTMTVNNNTAPVWTTPSGNIGGINLRGDVISETLVATDSDGLPASLTYLVVVGTLPAGLSLNDSSGAITGTLTGVATNETFTVRTDDGFEQADRNFTIRVNIPPIFSTSGDIGSVQEGLSDSFQVTANSGGDGHGQTVTYAVQVGPLPTGYSLNASSGAITGTAGSVGSNTTFNFTIRASDGLETTDQAHSITIINNTIPVWTTSSGNIGGINLRGDVIATAIVATDSDGAPLALTYSISVGSLPAGLSLNTSTGAITGTLTGSAVNETFTGRATDGIDAITRSFTIRVNIPPIFSTSGDIGSVQEGANDSFQVTANSGGDGHGQTVTYAVQIGPLPTGYSLNASSGAITGTAGSVGSNTTFNFTIRASDGLETTDQAHSITIINNIAPIWTTPSGNIGGINLRGDVIATAIVATDSDGAPLALTYSITVGSLPAGLSLNASTGAITGTLTGAAVNQTFTGRATDGIDAITRSFTIRVNIPPIFSTSGNIGSVQEGANDSFQVIASNGADGHGQPVTYAVQIGPLPTGYSLNASSGAITGTAGSVGSNTTFTFTIRASDGLETTDQAHSITIINNIAPIWTTPSGNIGGINLRGNVVSETLQATDSDGAPLALTYSITVGSLPAGLSLNASSGAITGTLTGAATNETFTGRATDGINPITRSFTIRVNIPPIFSTSGNIGSVQEGLSDSFQVTANSGGDGHGQPVTYAVQIGPLPTGYSLNASSGAITGTAGSVGVNTTFNFTIRASDGLETTDQAHSITIINNLAPVFSTPAGSLDTIVDGEVYAGTSPLVAIDSDGAPLPVTYTTVDTLPTGVTLTTAGVLSGIVANASITQDSIFTFTVIADDGLDTDSRQFSITVNCNVFEASATTSTFVSDLNLIHGTGTGNRGYGQSNFPTVTVGNCVVKNNLTDWRTAVANMATHQGITLSPALASLSLINTIPFTNPTGFFTTLNGSNLQQAELVPLTVAAGQVTTTVSKLSSARINTPWNTEILHAFNVTFTNTDAARHFFNTGGQIRFDATRTGGSATTQNTNWTTLVDANSIFIFDSSDYFALTGTTNTVIATFTGGGAYTSNTWKIQGWRTDVAGSNGGHGAALRFVSRFTDGHANVFFDSVNGTFTSIIGERRATGVFAQASPTFTTVTAMTIGS